MRRRTLQLGVLKNNFQNLITDRHDGIQTGGGLLENNGYSPAPNATHLVFA